MPAATRMRRMAPVWWYALVALLLLVRLPSLAQPAGADQGLYSYVGTRILVGELPYRDAWDQKPPAIHFVYALLYALWPHESVVPAADLACAAVIAIMLVPLGRALTGGESAGRLATPIFLLLGDPTFSRLAGVRIRSQCETFIGLAVTAALLVAVTSRVQRAPSGTVSQREHGWGTASRALMVGALLGMAVTLKYNAIVYAPVVVVGLAIASGDLRRGVRLALLAGSGMAILVLTMLSVFAIGGALRDLYYATITYNLEYSGETYHGAASFVAYLVSFPIRQARIDALWTVGGLGCLILAAHFATNRAQWRLLLPVIWVGAACLSIAINGSRGLPQYFVQAAPALALAAGVAGAILWPATRVPVRLRPAVRMGSVLLLATAAWRVADFVKIPRNASHDLAYLTGQVSRTDHLARFGGRQDDKYIALAIARLAEYLSSRTEATDRIYIFGFSPGAYVQAQRVSASRFFWSRPVIVGFNAHVPGYGSRGVLDELRSRSPAYVVLQVGDWAPSPGDSALYFLNDPLLGEWLRTYYRRAEGFVDDDYDVWERRPL